ncbi:DNA/RNA helicase, superfamily II [Sanguibacter keddieii DSM 10542]|uniref:DNA/RNA helicase, superfamily II n=1 Tax=Sanguibacter keddieii (strain ATCC 51767 / DSM 10542 / NCFB 3025 / ST-74) TaxID=446469 RepID=D1BE44_SANKS|nr:DEAD/DEAH box helicase [Sanguibacter keddieii]ACZ23265.1 DNA/RNA helicase, superfamily II [Sanguibacter keddieii DSM 10542]
MAAAPAAPLATSFDDFALPAPIISYLADNGIAAPFPIQSATLGDTLEGRDVLGRGRTGSGKTLAFSLPTVTRLAADGGRRRPARPRGLVMCPTRELANQINATMEPLAKLLGLKTTTIFGGVAQSRQVTALQGGVDIVIACPGRLEDLLGQGLLSLDDVEITVLDEADHMADLGFLPGVKRIMDRTPSKGQRLLFSATLDNGVDQLVKRYMDAPTSHSVDSADSHVSTMSHHIFEVADAAAKRDVIRELASGVDKRVLFTRTKHQAKKLAKQLTADGIPAVDLHGNLGQGARERNLEAFSSGAVKVLVATDIAARGIHVDEVSLVVHVDPPAEHKAYTHRSGRTARAGSGGDVVTIMLPEQRGDVRDLTRQAKINAQPRKVVPGDALVTDLIGEVADYVTPAPVQEQPQQRQGGGGGGRGRSGRGGSSAGGSGEARGGARGGSSRGGASAGGGRGGSSRGVTTYSTSTPSAGGGSGSGRRSSGGGQQAAAGSGASTGGGRSGASRGRRRAQG